MSVATTKNPKQSVVSKASREVSGSGGTERRWIIAELLSREGDAKAPFYFLAGFVAFSSGVCLAWGSLAQKLALPWWALIIGATAVVWPVPYLWNVMPVRPRPRARLARILLAAVRPILWPFAILVAALISGFVNSSLSGDSARHDLTSTLSWAVLFAIIAGMGQGAFTTVNLTMPADREIAITYAKKAFPDVRGWRHGRFHESIVGGLAVAYVGVATTWLGVIGTWCVGGAILWQIWVALDFTL